MKSEHEMSSGQFKFFIAIHFMTELEKTELQQKMRSRVEKAKGRQTTEKSKQRNKKTEVIVQIQNDDDLLFVEDDTIECSFDGVKVAKKLAVERLKDVLFNDAPRPRGNILSNISNNVKINPIDSNPINTNRTDYAKLKNILNSPYQHEKLQVKIKSMNITGRSFKSCEFCDKEFKGQDWHRDYNQHMERIHSNQTGIEHRGISNVTTNIGSIDKNKVITTKPIEITNKVTTKPIQITNVATKPIEITKNVDTKPIEIANKVITTKPIEVTDEVTTTKQIEAATEPTETNPVEIHNDRTSDKPVEITCEPTAITTPGNQVVYVKKEQEMIQEDPLSGEQNGIEEDFADISDIPGIEVFENVPDLAVTAIPGIEVFEDVPDIAIPGVEDFEDVTDGPMSAIPGLVYSTLPQVYINQ